MRRWNTKRRTLSYPNVGVVKEAQCRTHELPYAHLLEESKFAETGESEQDTRDDAFLDICDASRRATRWLVALT